MRPAPKKKTRPTNHLLEIADLRIRLDEAEETLRAIRKGEIDGIVVLQGAQGKQLYTLKGADESYRTLVEAMSEGALILDSGGTILYANKRFSEMIKTPLSQVMGMRARDFVPGDLHAAYQDLMRGCETASAQQETVLRRPDKTLVPVLLSAGPMNLEAKSRIGLIVTDLTDQKERERVRGTERRTAEDQIRRHVANLETSNRQLETSNRELEAFVYSVSHDLRAPLRSVHRYGKLIQEDYDGVLDATAKDHLDRITAAAMRMDDHILNLLSYSRVSVQEIALRALDTTSVVSEVLKNMTDDLEERQAEVLVERPLPGVMGDEVLLTQAFTNLISNGIKFILSGERPRIKVWGEIRGSSVRLWVRDNGIGISEGEQKRLFRLFERLNKKYHGTGVGLAIVKRAVERMGGTVGVESRAGQGSAFWVELKPTGGEVR